MANVNDDISRVRIETWHPYLAALRRGVLLYDGSMGVFILNRNPTGEDYGGLEGCNEHLLITRPHWIEEIHAAYLDAGAQVIETNTFGGNRLKLDEYGLGERTHEINRLGAGLARRVADRYSTPDHPRFVAGSIGPTGMLPSSSDPALSNISFEELAAIFYEQGRALMEGGCDVLIVETMQDILETRAAIVGINRMFRDVGRRIPLQVQVTLDTSGRMLLGTDIAAAMTTIECLPVDVIGLNCSTGPDYMREPVRYLCEHSRLPVAVIPNAGLPINVDGRAVYPQTPEDMARQLREFVVEFGVNIIGGCCVTTPEHIRAFHAAIQGVQPKERQIAWEPLVASAIRAVSLHQEPKPLLVGERVNSTGSRKMKRLLLAEDYDGILQIAREQVEGGAHVLDVSVAVTERTDEAEQMAEVVRRLSMGVEAPLVIDSTEWQVFERALQHYPGRAILNSINMENGRERIDRVLPIAREHGCAVVALTIDEPPLGMAKTREHKLEVARKIHRIATEEYGLANHDLIFDTLTFPLSTGEEEFKRSAVETIEGIRLVKAALPGVLTILGISNVSFGFSPTARAVLNSVFLYHAVEAGLDLAIVNPREVTPYLEIPEVERQLADDLIFDRRADAAARFIEYFERRGAVASAAAAVEDPTAGMSAEAAIHWKILHRKREGIEALIDEALTRRSPVGVLNEVLLPAMKDVGDRFGAGELILPFVLQSAEVMKRAVAHVEKYLEKKEGASKGKVVLATVYGDVHDIGKNLVDTILSNNGYTVYNLGKQVPINTIIDKAVEVGADAIGLSALLVSTSKQMPLCVQELHKRGLDFPVIVGGASINRQFGRRILFPEPGVVYEPGVFYAKDAFEGLEIMDALTDPARGPALVERVRREAIEGDDAARQERIAAGRAAAERVLTAGVPADRSNVARDVPIPAPPFWGWRVLREADVPLDEVFAHLDLNTLFRLHWGGKTAKGARFEEVRRTTFEPALAELKAEAKAKGWLQPRVIYGYFPARSQGNDLIVYDPADPQREVVRFTFPRQPDLLRLCLSDYFAPVESGRTDVAVFQVVTVGDAASEYAERLREAGEYERMLYVHGLSVQSAEALAEWTHTRVRRELGLAPDQGRRYSWGYPACPDLEQHALLFELMPIEREAGVRLTTGWQLDPEQSTAALVVHHPEATYFSIREDVAAPAARETAPAAD